MKANLVTEAKKLLNQLEPGPPAIYMGLERNEQGEVIITGAYLRDGYTEDLIIQKCYSKADMAFFNAFDASELAEQTRKRLIDEKQ
jgi:hypothetical protein